MSLQPLGWSCSCLSPCIGVRPSSHQLINACCCSSCSTIHRLEDRRAHLNPPQLVVNGCDVACGGVYYTVSMHKLKPLLASIVVAQCWLSCQHHGFAVALLRTPFQHSLRVTDILPAGSVGSAGGAACALHTSKEITIFDRRQISLAVGVWAIIPFLTLALATFTGILALSA